MFTSQLIAPNCLPSIRIDYAWRITAERLPAITCCMEMSLMTLQTQERLVLKEQVVGYCPVSIVAESAVFDHGLMLEHKGSLITGVAFQTEIVQTLIGLEHAGYQVIRSMGLVAVSAAHFAFPDRVAGHQIAFGLNILVTLAAEFELVGVRKKGFLLVEVDVVTFEAGYIVLLMI